MADHFYARVSALDQNLSRQLETRLMSAAYRQRMCIRFATCSQNINVRHYLLTHYIVSDKKRGKKNRRALSGCISV